MVLCQTNPYLNLKCADTGNICKYFLTCHHACCQSKASQFIHIHSKCCSQLMQDANLLCQQDQGSKTVQKHGKVFLSFNISI